MNIVTAQADGMVLASKLYVIVDAIKQEGGALQLVRRPLGNVHTGTPPPFRRTIVYDNH